MRINWTRGTPIGRNPVITYRSPSSQVKRTDVLGYDSLTRQPPLIGDPKNNEEWRNDLLVSTTGQKRSKTIGKE